MCDVSGGGMGMEEKVVESFALFTVVEVFWIYSIFEKIMIGWWNFRAGWELSPFESCAFYKCVRYVCSRSSCVCVRNSKMIIITHVWESFLRSPSTTKSTVRSTRQIDHRKKDTAERNSNVMCPLYSQNSDVENFKHMMWWKPFFLRVKPCKTLEYNHTGNAR